MKDQFSNRQGLGSETPSPDASFANPEMFYAPNAFWLWNGKEELAKPEVAAKQAAEMRKQNLNPGYAHARFWKAGELFWHSENWFKSFKAAVEQAEKDGVHFSYVMGDPCVPDKFLLPHEHRPRPEDYFSPDPMPNMPELEAVSLKWSVKDVEGGAEAALPESFFSVAAKLDSSKRLLSSSLKIVGAGDAFKWKAPAGELWRVYSFSKYREKGNQYCVNFLDSRFAKPWLNVENATYEKLFSKHFGKTMRGVFFDLEGSYGYKIAWSDDLPKAFKKSKGADLRALLPLLLEEDAEGLWPKLRYDWFDVVGKLYIDCVFKPFDKWCRSKGMFGICHFWEERLFMQAAHVGNYFAMQRSYSMPATDALFETIRDPRYSRETQSVCEFEGRQFMCEAFAVAGWQLNSTDLKKDFNCAVAFGISQLILGGIDTKNDPSQVGYPPDLFHWNPYWRNFKLLADFSRRACYVNDHGRLDAKTLLLCPMDSVWSLVGDGFFDPAQYYRDPIDEDKIKFSGLDEIKRIDDSYSAAMRALTEARVECMIADSHYLEKMKAGKSGELSLGDFSFESLVLPPLRLLRLESAKRIVEFAKAGGKVFALGSLPVASAEKGLNDPELAKLMKELREAKGFVDAKGGLAALLAKKTKGLEPAVVFKSGEFPLLVSRRKLGERSFYWLANNDDAKHDCVLLLPGAFGRAELWNCESGDRSTVGSKELKSGSEVKLTLEPNDGVWLVFDPKKKAVKPEAKPKLGEKLSLDGEWTVSVDLSCQPDMAGREILAPEWLLKGGAKRELASWLDWGLDKFTGFVDYEKDFELESVSGDELLDLGALKNVAEVMIDGKSAGAKIWAPFTFEIGKLLKPGRNHVKIKAGNTVLNSLTQIASKVRWGWTQKPPERKDLDSGLLGPVRILAPK